MEEIRAAAHWLDWRLWRNPTLATRLGVSVSPTFGLRKALFRHAYIGWGLKRSGLRAMTMARRNQAACWLLEDGFIRSLGGNNSPSYSLVVDSLGIYYDARHPSQLETYICRSLTSSQSIRARSLIRSWREGLISKYNAARDIDESLLPSSYILIVDQTAGDASILGGLAKADAFHQMLQDALATASDRQVVLKLHPEVVRGKKTGHFDIKALSSCPRIHLITDDVHPAELIARADAIYTVTSQIGFEALLWEKPVHVYGMPFYAGWGLTHDKLPRPHRRYDVPLEQLVHAALIDYPRYFDPYTGERCEVETIMDWLALQRAQRRRFGKRLTAFGFSKWKHAIVRDFLAGSHVTFVNTLQPNINREDQIVTWGHKHKRQLEQYGYGANVLRIEDGFLRSIGLGAEFIRPLSWVIDSSGIYYDAHQPSGLENILKRASFDSSLIDRAIKIRTELVSNGITKYNLPQSSRWQCPAHVSGVILIIGQVESDAAITYGANKIRHNIDLLKAVRVMRPDSWLVYKPHPDVVAGLRNPGWDENSAEAWCDEIVTQASLTEILPFAEEVHVLSSLAGFEALLRGVPVITWGQPFYAGWGLTRDRALSPAVAQRRSRRLTLDELVAAVLILYPTYVSRKTHNFCTAERAIEELKQWRAAARPQPIRRLAARLLRKP